MPPLADVERSARRVQDTVRPRVGPPEFVYRGQGDAHLRGQACHWLAAERDDRVLVVMSCGCQISVPWWTLEPRTA